MQVLNNKTFIIYYSFKLKEVYETSRDRGLQGFLLFSLNYKNAKKTQTESLTSLELLVSIGKNNKYIELDTYHARAKTKF